MESYWTAYFDLFHQAFPILHKPTLSMKRCNPLLLAIISGIGASYSSQRGSQEYSTKVFQKLCASLPHKSTEDTKLKHPGSILSLTVYCLLCCHILRSRSPGFFNHAVNAQSDLLAQGKKLGLFSPYDILDTEKENGTPESSDDSCHEGIILSLLDDSEEEGTMTRWVEWVRGEQRKRLGWGILGLHCLCCLLTFRPSDMLGTEVRLRMPCSETLWNARSPSAWQSSIFWSKYPARELPFSGVLNNLLVNDLLVKKISRFGRMICAFVLEMISFGLGGLQILGLQEREAEMPAVRERLIRSLASLRRDTMDTVAI